MNTPDALLIIDMQLVAFDGEVTQPIQDGAQLLRRSADLVAACRAAGLRIIYVQTRAASGQPYAQDVHGWEIHPLISPEEEDTTVYKVNSNGFQETELAAVLANLGVTSLMTCGIWSEYCLARTSMAAMELGFQVHVAADAHGTVAESPEAARVVVAQQNALLKRAGAKVSTVQEIQELLREK